LPTVDEGDKQKTKMTKKSFRFKANPDKHKKTQKKTGYIIKRR